MCNILPEESRNLVEVKTYRCLVSDPDMWRLYSSRRGGVGFRDGWYKKSSSGPALDQLLLGKGSLVKNGEGI